MSRCTPRRPRLEFLEGRLAPAGVTASYSVSQDWGSGFQGEIRLVSQQSTNVSGWRLEFDFAANISSLWDGKITAHTGQHYTIEGASWNKDLAANGTVSFGFVASPLQTAPKPTTYLLNGVPLGGSATLPSLSIEDVTVNEGNSGTTPVDFTIRLSAASTSPITVRYASADGTATAGSDYQAGSGVVTFAAGQTSKTVRLLVNGDTAFEGDETFRLRLSDPTGAVVGRAEATATVRNDDTSGTPTGTIIFEVQNDWGSGFTGQISIRNPGTTAMANWTLAFDFPGTISSIWNASIAQHTGSRYLVKPESWNATIPAGGVVSFGFTANPGGGSAVPTNFVLSGTGSGGGGGGNGTPTAVNDGAWTNAGQAVQIRVLDNDSDPDGDTLTVSAAGPAGHGSLVKNADGTIRYTPQAGYTGSDTFAYTISDGKGGTATANVTVNVGMADASTWPGQFSASYIDATLWPTFDFVATARATNLRRFTLAFIVADPQNRPSWGGYAEYAVNGGAFDQHMRSNVSALRAMGGDVMVSFGGASNRELAEVITDVTALKNAYRQVVDAYNLTHVDFDIEGGAAADRAAIDRRSQALAALQRDLAAAGRPLEIWLTLPVLPTGLTPDGVYVVQSAVRAGVQLAGVNIMAMDYGDSAAPNPQGKMGDYAIQAAQSLHAQLRQVYGSGPSDAQLWRLVGVTPMIGMNDVQTEIFDQQEARELVAFAQQVGMGRLSLWSLNRDRQSPNGVLGYVDLQSSSILQQPLEFSLLFEQVTR